MIRIELLGASFQIQSDEQPEYLAKVLNHVRGRVRDIERTVATDDPLKKAILASFLITDDLFRERERGESASGHSPDTGEIATIAQQLIERIDQVLPDDTQPTD